MSTSDLNQNPLSFTYYTQVWKYVVSLYIFLLKQIK